VQATSLASGSSGNALVIEHEGAALLVDCGLAPRKLAALLREAGILPAKLSGVLLTHEHSDHVAGINAIPRKADVPFYMTAGTRRANPRVAGTEAFAGRPVVEQPLGSTRSVGPFEVTSFPVSHDGAEVCGYLIEAAGRAVAVFTDLGMAESHLYEPLARAELLVIESNHDEGMLWNGPYPWHLKRRVASPRGHLSNVACAGLLCDVLPTAGREIWLAHLSRTNNRAPIASGAVRGTLNAFGIKDDAHMVRVLPAEGTELRWQPAARQLALGI
jgi:phosphoribosyl 1,2-cyclic phosphodiesterase